MSDEEVPTPQPAKKTRTRLPRMKAGRVRLYPKISLEVYYAILAEAKRTNSRTDQVAATILRWWHEDCVKADAVRLAKEKAG